MPAGDTPGQRSSVTKYEVAMRMTPYRRCRSDRNQGGDVADTAVKSFDSPDERPPFEDKGEMRIVNVGDVTVGRGTFEPGWRWEQNVKPIAGTHPPDLSPRLRALGSDEVFMDDGNEQEIAPAASSSFRRDTTPR